MPSESWQSHQGQTCKYIIMYLHVINMLHVHHMSNVLSVKIHSDTVLHGSIKKGAFNCLGREPQGNSGWADSWNIRQRRRKERLRDFACAEVQKNGRTFKLRKPPVASSGYGQSIAYGEKCEKAQRNVTKEMAELMLKCTQESKMKSGVCHALEEDVTFMVREVTCLQSVMGLEEDWGAEEWR